MNLSKFAYAYSRHGLIGFFNVMFGKIGIRYRLKTPLDKIIFYLGKSYVFFWGSLKQSLLFNGNNN